MNIVINVSTDDRARFDRHGEPVAIGVSFARGEVASADNWSAVDQRGEAVPVQATVLDRWADQSLRWMLVEFRADASAGATSKYTLFNKPAATSALLTITPSADGFVVDTGTARFIVPQRGAVGIARVDVENKTVLTELTVSAEDGQGRSYSLAIERASVTRAGPLTGAVTLEGALVASDAVPWIDASLSLQFHAGLGAVKVELTCTNPRAAAHPNGIWDLGDPGSVMIRDLSVRMRPAPQPASIIASISPDLSTPSGERFEIYQDSSGGENWHSPNHVDRSGQIATAFRGFRALVDGAQVDGFRATPIASMHAGDSRITIGCPLFWEVFPKSLSLTRESCTVGVLPGQSSVAHELQGGERVKFAFMLAVGEDPVSSEPLAWARSPLRVTVDPESYRRAGTWAPLTLGTPEAQREYEGLVRSVISGELPFSDRRELVDEYGWRHFGEIYADHEAVGRPGLISHYNNQYDVIAGMATRFMQDGDARWWSPMCELAAHVTTIDLYNTRDDRAAYNGGYFWHTQHYAEAGTATHRAYSHLSVQSGGGPSAEHNYTSGLLLHHFLTGDQQSRAAVIQLANWVLDMDDGRKGRFRWIDRRDTGLASSTRSPDFHGPGRGAGNSINALLDAHRLTGDDKYLDKADALVRRCVHPEDNQDALDLLDAENRWSYTVFLQVLGKYLHYRADRGLIDDRYSYARAVLLNYARWMADHERPYLERPERLEYPNETWAAQDIRKAAVLEFASRHSDDETERIKFLQRAQYFFEYSVTTLSQSPTGRLARPLALLLAYGFQRPLAQTRIGAVALPVPTPGRRVEFVPLRKRVIRRLIMLAAAGGLLMIGLLLAVFLL